MSYENKKVPVKVPVNNNDSLSLKIRFNILKKLYSEPKIYRYKKTDENGKKHISVEKQWHVYYYFRNPDTLKMDKFIEKIGINSAKTKTEREKAANNLKKALKRYLQEGYNPFEERKTKINNVNIQKYTFSDAIDIAYNAKKNTWGQITTDVNKGHLRTFKNWIKEQKLENSDIKEISKKHISFYLSYLMEKRNIGNTTRNNHRRFLSSLFGEMVQKEIIDFNFIENIKKLEERSKKNKPFDTKLLDKILNYTKETDPYLYSYIKVMWYTFLRPIEIIRLKVDNISLNDRTIEVLSKTDERAHIRIVEPIHILFTNLKLEKFKNDMYIFTKHEKIDYWITGKEKSKEDFFTRRFRKIKKHFNLSADYGVYSFRHSAALSLYYNFLNVKNLSQQEAIAKVQEIMRHRDMETTKKYLREIGGQLAKDWSKDYDYNIT